MMTGLVYPSVLQHVIESKGFFTRSSSAFCSYICVSTTVSKWCTCNESYTSVFSLGPILHYPRPFVMFLLLIICSIIITLMFLRENLGIDAIIPFANCFWKKALNLLLCSSSLWWLCLGKGYLAKGRHLIKLRLHKLFTVYGFNERLVPCRTVLFTLTSVVVLVITTDWISWDKLNRGFLPSDEVSRAFLASFILVFDLLIVMQVSVLVFPFSHWNALCFVLNITNTVCRVKGSIKVEKYIVYSCY